MFLKSLSIKGFKSFAEPTVLHFEPGITVVVGPNGSGKSNVVDAVTWVMGAQGPRALRSQRMEDVIFAGTASRPALGRAEVSLTIDNSSGKLPLEMAEVTITRLLFRSGESEYAINGQPCRLLDVQELLSDTGVGRNQHMIIGQGQLETVLSARPEDRRAIIEDAAGVRKHRRRRERAERRLEATQENLERLGDLLREVRRQIRPLERQAAAARSHAELSAELMALRRHLAGVELLTLAERERSANEKLGALQEECEELEATLSAVDVAASAAANELASRREDDLASTLGKARALLERAKGSAELMRERRRGVGAALDAAADVDVVSTLEAEAARLASDLKAADQEAAALGPLPEEPADHSPEEALRAAKSRIELLVRSLEQAPLESLEVRVETLATRLAELEAADAALAAREEQLTDERARLAALVADSVARVDRALEAADEAERAARRADEERHRADARADALARALKELQGAGGREVLEGVDGVVGSLVELVDIDPGWEVAFEAAVGAALSAVVVNDQHAARGAVERLRTSGTTGALLPLAATAPVDVRTLPPGAALVRSHVRASPAIDRVLDGLVGSAVLVESWEQAVDVAIEHPELVVVTAHGDRFAPSGWQVRSSDGVVTAAAVERAAAQAAECSREADAAFSALQSAREALEDVRAAATAAARRLDAHDGMIATARVERRARRSERERVGEELRSAREALAQARDRCQADAEALAALRRSLPDLEASVAERAERQAERQRLKIALAGVEERRRVLTHRLAEVERRLQGHAEERERAAARRQRLEEVSRVLDRLLALVVTLGKELEGLVSGLEDAHLRQVEALRAGGERLEALRRDRVATERRLAVVRDRIRALELELTDTAVRREALVETIARELRASPEEVMGAPCPELPDGTTPAARVQWLSEQLAALGPVNPLALEELSDLERRYRELDDQMNDIRSARRELQELMRTLDRQIEQTFAEAVRDVNEHFSSLVEVLFPGGTGRLVLTDPEDLLNTGVDVEIRPAGRNVRRVALFSGGERALSALAFLFAVFKSRPSPFYLMDEVEAALDDVNLHRFLNLVTEFRNEAQLIIVSHQKRTMELADVLYGVTMAPGGSSKVLSQKVPEPSR